MRVRELTTTDLPALLAFYTSLSEATASLYHPFKFTEEAVGKHLAGADAEDTISLGLFSQDGSIVGHTFISSIRGEKPVFGIGLADEVQGRGWGRKLTETIIAQADALGLPLVTLTVYKVNERAKSLYEKIGFVVKGETEHASWYMERARPRAPSPLAGEGRGEGKK